MPQYLSPSLLPAGFEAIKSTKSTSSDCHHLWARKSWETRALQQWLSKWLSSAPCPPEGQTSNSWSSSSLPVGHFEPPPGATLSISIHVASNKPNKEEMYRNAGWPWFSQHNLWLVWHTGLACLWSKAECWPRWDTVRGVYLGLKSFCFLENLEAQLPTLTAWPFCAAVKPNSAVWTACRSKLIQVENMQSPCNPMVLCY